MDSARLRTLRMPWTVNTVIARIGNQDFRVRPCATLLSVLASSYGLDMHTRAPTQQKPEPEPPQSTTNEKQGSTTT
jgi:hypothetical protein